MNESFFKKSTFCNPILLWIAGITFLRLLLLFLFVHHFRFWEDHAMAVNLFKTGSLFYDVDGARNYAFQFPVYPFILHYIYLIFGTDPFYAAAYNIVLYFLSAIVFYKMISLFFQLNQKLKFSHLLTERITFFAVLVFLLHPAINYYCLFNIHPFSENMFFLFLTIYLFMRSICMPSNVNFILTGVVTGFAMLDRSTVLVVIILLVFIWIKYADFRMFLKGFFIIFFITTVITLPWVLRNKEITGSYIMVTSGKILWKGMLENSEGSNYLTKGGNYYRMLTDNEVSALGKMNASEQDSFFLNKYLTVLHKNPPLFVKLFFIKLKNFWWFRINIGNELPEELKSWILVYKLFYAVTVFFVLIAFYFHPKESFYVMLVPLLLSFFQSLFYVETRHRIIVEPFFLLLALIGFYSIKEKVYIILKRKTTPKKI